MSKKIDVIVRPKRQVTIPKEICEKLGIEPGDSLELSIEKSVLRAIPKKRKALDAMNEIHEMFKQYGISEKEMLKEVQKARREITFERGKRKR